MFVKLASVQQKSEIYEGDIVVIYSATCNATDVYACKRILFANGASVENIPPTSATLRPHIFRAVLKATKSYRCFEKQTIELVPSN